MGIARASSGMPVGAVMHYPVNSIPAGWLKANGDAVSRATYAGLFSVIGTTYGAGDGATTFNLPDLRAEFLRGLDDGRGIDAGRAVGSAQAGQMPSHTHNVGVALNSTVGGNGTPLSASQNANHNQPTAAAGGTTNASENRPRNVAMLACIKFRR
jgi:microcystin-dependent protein